MNFRTEKVGKRHTNIINAKTGEHVCQLLNKEVAPWLIRAERAARDTAEFLAARRLYRISAAEAYLAKRTVREAARGVQLSMF